MKHVNLRLPDDLHTALAAAAEADRRSLNSMIIVLIEQGLKPVRASRRKETGGDSSHDPRQ
jgi:predicted HicB family RNase H-like nuclease